MIVVGTADQGRASQLRWPLIVRFGSKAEKLDLSIRCPLYSRKRTLSDTTGMSALCQKRTYEHHLLAAGGQAVRDIKPTHCSIRRCPSWRRQPERAASIGPGRADVRARTVATRVTPAARLFACRLGIWRDLPDDEKGYGPLYWKRGIQEPVDER